MKKLLKYLKGYEKECVLGPLFKLLEATFELLVPLVVASIVDKGIGSGDRGYIVKMCAVMIGLGQFGDSAVFFCCGGGGLFHTAAAYGAGAYSELKLQSGR